MAATGGVCHFDVDSGSFIFDIGTLMWLSGTLMLASTLFFLNYFLKRRYDIIEL